MPELVHVQQSYSAEDVEAGLLELACRRGNSRRASAALAERGIRIPWRTLHSWRQSHADRLAELEAEVLPKIRARMAVDQERVVGQATEATLSLIQRLKQEAHKIPARDLAGAVRNMEVTAATAIDKHALLNDLPTEIHRGESVDGIFKELQAKYPGLIVESTAEEISDAEVVEEEAPKGRVVGATAHKPAPKRPRAKPAKQGN